MDDRFFFNPYAFTGNFPGGYVPPNAGFPPNISFPPNIAANTNAENVSPKEFYDNQYSYYRCLNEAMDYQIKSRDYFEKLNSQKTKNS